MTAWLVEGGDPGAVLSLDSAEEVLETISRWHTERRGRTPWLVQVSAPGADAAALVVGVGADHVPVYFTLERANARSVGPLPTVTAPAPESGERVWRWPSGIVPPDDDPAWAAFDAWLAEGRRLRGDAREDPTFRLRGEWEHPDPGELIPFEQAYAALAEFLSTGRRPTNVVWEDL